MHALCYRSEFVCSFCLVVINVYDCFTFALLTIVNAREVPSLVNSGEAPSMRLKKDEKHFELSLGRQEQILCNYSGDREEWQKIPKYLDKGPS